MPVDRGEELAGRPDQPENFSDCLGDGIGWLLDPSGVNCLPIYLNFPPDPHSLSSLLSLPSLLMFRSVLRALRSLFNLCCPQMLVRKSKGMKTTTISTLASFGCALLLTTSITPLSDGRQLLLADHVLPLCLVPVLSVLFYGMWRVSGCPMVFPAYKNKADSFTSNKKVRHSTGSMSQWAPAPRRLGTEDIEDADDEMELSDDTHDELEVQELREAPKSIERMHEDDCAMHIEDADGEEDFEISSRSSADVVGDGLQDSWSSCNWVASPVPIDAAAHVMSTHGQIGLDVLDNDFQAIDFNSLEAAVGYKFKSRTLLVEAITHASRLSSDSPCYQRLEFVGDAVLDHLITKYFFVNYKDLAPGRLTDLRQATVNNENFARIAVKHKFHLHLQHGSAALQAKIHAFVKNIQAELDEPGLNAFGLGDFKAPKVLGDILESIAGAVFLDAGLNTEKVWQIFEPLLQPMVTPETLLKHPVSELQERCQQRVEDLRYHPYRRDTLTFVVEVYVNEECIAAAANSKKKMAQKLAARNALVILKKRDERAAAEEDGSSDTAEIVPGVPDTHSNMPIAQQNFYEMCMKRNCKQTLYEICMSQKWPKPEYKCVSEVGLAHAKKFTYSVRIYRDQGWSEELAGEPMPSVKRAKDSAAATLLQHLKRW